MKYSKVIIAVNATLEISLLFLFIYHKLLIPMILLGLFTVLYHIPRLNKFLNAEDYAILGDRLPLRDCLKKKECIIHIRPCLTPISNFQHVTISVVLLLFIVCIIWLSNNMKIFDL